MKCDNTFCIFNQNKSCNRIGAILDDLEIGIPEPDDCPLSEFKYNMSEE